MNIFGIAAGHLPASPPFSISLSTGSPLPRLKNLLFSNETLNVAIQNRHAFYELYVAVTKRAIDLYAKSGRRKFALKLHGCLAAFELYVLVLFAKLGSSISSDIREICPQPLIHSFPFPPTIHPTHGHLLKALCCRELSIPTTNPKNLKMLNGFIWCSHF